MPGEFEQKYYEAEEFWTGNMVQDAANMKRIELTADFVGKDVRSLVDVGCGNGVFLNYLSQTKSGIDLTGTDRSVSALRFVKSNKVHASIESLPFEDQSFDCVTCLEVIEHLPTTIYPAALEELARISRKYIIISVPYKEVLEDSYTKCPSCKSIFNYELHLRSFDDGRINELFLSKGFKCVRTATTGSGVHFKGHRQFRKIFYPEQQMIWNSPICPICGYSQEKPTDPAEITSGKSRAANLPSRKLISYLSALPKLFWPKERKDYWIIALYERN